jgi:GNAT superfamily N-acetyltransferase
MMCNPRPRHSKGLQLRVARHTERLAELVAFYTDGIGLVELGSFRDHDGYAGVFLGIPGTEAHLELTSGGTHGAPTPHVESLLVLYVGDQDALDTIAARMAVEPVAPANPYWSEHGLTFEDPDGFRIVLVPERWQVRGNAAERIRVERHFGPRLHLRSLFELAEDSGQALNSYIDTGDVFIAQEGSRVVGYVQITATDRADVAEIKSIAVDPSMQGQGIGCSRCFSDRACADASALDARSCNRGRRYRQPALLPATWL